MALLEIKIFPDPGLRVKAQPVKKFDGELKKLAEDMIETMRAQKGVGLAAPQVGVSLRLIVIDTVQEGEQGSALVLTNPRIVKRSGEIIWNEGCLSFPGIYEEIKRSESVVVQAQDLDGKEVEVKGEGLLAVVLQHELDHLEGILIFDFMSYLRKKLVKRDLRKRAQQAKKEAKT